MYGYAELCVSCALNDIGGGYQVSFKDLPLGHVVNHTPSVTTLSHLNCHVTFTHSTTTHHHHTPTLAQNHTTPPIEPPPSPHTLHRINSTSLHRLFQSSFVCVVLSSFCLCRLFVPFTPPRHILHVSNRRFFSRYSRQEKPPWGGSGWRAVVGRSWTFCCVVWFSKRLVCFENMPGHKTVVSKYLWANHSPGSGIPLGAMRGRKRGHELIWP